jgi:hypothetical protein
MHQFFGGRAGQALIENFSPSAKDGVIIAMDENKDLMNEVFICSNCFMMTEISLSLLMEKRRKD